MVKSSLLKPVLKWVGGKRRLYPTIAPHLPTSPKLYIEPFVGGAAVLLSKQPMHARINDYNEELINVYNVIRDTPEQLIKVLQKHEKHNSREYYYDIRALDRNNEYKKMSNVDRAARIMYLNKTCYNGMFRVNSAGQLNVPYGRYKRPNIVDAPAILALSNYLDGDIEICCGDYANVLKDLPNNAFVYFDPPYFPVSQTADFTGYTECGFGIEEQVRLRDECVKLREQGIHFVESNSFCSEVEELYKDFTIEIIAAGRSINSRADKRGPVNEVLIIG